MKHFFFFVFLSFQLSLFAQEEAKESFTVQKSEVKDDLNNDKLEDKVIITQDTISDTAPFRMQIFFAEPNGKYELFYSSSSIIEPQYPIARICNPCPQRGVTLLRSFLRQDDKFVVKVPEK